jgi:hypothetical protein
MRASFSSQKKNVMPEADPVIPLAGTNSANKKPGTRPGSFEFSRSRLPIS